MSSDHANSPQENIEEPNEDERAPLPIKEGILTGKFESELELLKRHIILLKAIHDQQPIGIIRLSETLSLPQHKVRYSLRLLEQEGLIVPSAEGAVTTKKFIELFPQLRTTLKNFNDELNEILDLFENF